MGLCRKGSWCKKHRRPPPPLALQLMHTPHPPRPPTLHLPSPHPLNKLTHMLKDRCSTNGSKGWARALYEKCIVQPGAIKPPPSRLIAQQSRGPLRGGRGGLTWNGVAVDEGEAVAASLGCYLLAYFESPAASCTPCHSHWSCPDLPEIKLMQPQMTKSMSVLKGIKKVCSSLKPYST